MVFPAQDSPTNKLLYAKEIPEYRKIVQRYYKQIQDMTPLSEQEMNAHLAEESRVGGLWGLGKEVVSSSGANWGRKHGKNLGAASVSLLCLPLQQHIFPEVQGWSGVPSRRCGEVGILGPGN